MTHATAPSPSVSPDTRLVEFARACKGAARAVTLYPNGHPAIEATLRRIVSLTSVESLEAPLTLSVTPDSLQVNGRAPKPDAAIVELAALLHSHGVGQLTIHPGGSQQAWHRFLVLLGRDAQSVREEGGLTRSWAAGGGGHIDVREIDYAEALRERSGSEAASWDHIVASCLDGQKPDVNDPATRALMEAAGNGEGIAALASAVDGASGEGTSAEAKACAFARALRGIVDGVPSDEPGRLEAVLRAAAGAIEHLSPDVVLNLTKNASADREPALMDAVVSRMSDDDVARFIARHVGSTAAVTRLAEAFWALAPDADHQQRLLTLARNIAAESPLGAAASFDGIWNRAAEELVTSYSDGPYGEKYGRELSSARQRAIQVEEAAADPPERIEAWLDTVTTTALRGLDLQLLLDLLRVDQDAARWGVLMTPVVHLLEDLFLVGDFDAAQHLISVLVDEAHNERSARRSHAADAIDLLIDGLMVRHLTAHLATVDEPQFASARAMCVSLGEVIVRPLAEALSIEERPQTRERLTSILVAFGPVARKSIEQLRSSPTLAIRRTAQYLLRELGGSDALPKAADILDGSTRRDALRTIVKLGTDEGYAVLLDALTAATPVVRDQIVHAVSGVRDERAATLFLYVLRHAERRRTWIGVVLRTVEALGALRDDAAVEPLRELLHERTWWAPRRTALLRTTAAAALARIGTSDAITVLEDAAADGPRAVRTAARVHLGTLRASEASVTAGRA